MATSGRMERRSKEESSTSSYREAAADAAPVPFELCEEEMRKRWSWSLEQRRAWSQGKREGREGASLGRSDFPIDAEGIELYRAEAEREGEEVGGRKTRRMRI